MLLLRLRMMTGHRPPDELAMSNKRMNRTLVHSRRLSVRSSYEKRKKSYTYPYSITAVLTTTLSFALAEYIQHGSLPFPATALLPVIIPLVVSSWSSGVLDSLLAWRFIFIPVSLFISLLLFLPLLQSQPFKTRLAIMATQLAIIVACLLISVPILRTFSGWMSV